MRLTVITITSLFIFWTSAVYAVNPSQNVIPQGAFKGQNIENLEEAEAIFLKGPDMTPNAVQREDLPGISQWSTNDYINASPKNRRNALLNMGLYHSKTPSGVQRSITIIGEGEKHSEMRTAPINTWTKEQYLNITPSERYNAINNMQTEPTVAAGGETNIEERTKAIGDYSQEELLNITPDNRHDAITGANRSFMVGGRSHNNTTITLKEIIGIQNLLGTCTTLQQEHIIIQITRPFQAVMKLKSSH